MFATLWSKPRSEVEFATLAGSPPGTPHQPTAVAGPATLSLSSCSSGSSGASCGSGDAGVGDSREGLHGGRGLLEAAGSGSNLRALVTAGAVEAASVRQKAQYFEALIRTNTDTLIRCASSSGGQRRCQDGDMEDVECTGSESEAEEHWQDYSEVQLVLRVPNRRPPASQPQQEQQPVGSHPQYGSPDEMAALIEQLQEQLRVKEREKQLTASALSRKTQECENLMRVVRELADSRAKVVSAKANLQEKYLELQSEYHRSIRIAELSRTVSKENLAKTSRAQKILRQTEDELHSTRKQAAQLQTKSKKLKVENSELKEKLNLLERLDCFDGVQESVCMREYTRYRLQETY